jgi:hypothetical protein
MYRFEAAADFSRGLSLGGAPGDVGPSSRAAAHPGERDGVDGAVQVPVPAAVEPVPDSSPAAGRDGAGAAERGERGLAAAPARVGEAHDGLGGADRPDPVAAGQAGGDVIDDGQQLRVVVLELLPGLALWVPKTCVTWADALQIAVGATRIRTSGGQVLVRPEVG